MDWISGWCRSQRHLTGITAIITGCNTGIGKETALDFYKRGARVIMACRSLERAEAAKADIKQKCKDEPNVGELIIKELDLSKLKSVREFVDNIIKNEAKLQILINNAGIMMHPQTKTEDGFEIHMGTNHFGPALLTLLLMPVLRKSAPSRILFVSSMLHEKGQIYLDDINFENKTFDSLEAYSRSKAANVLYARALATKLKENNINDVTTYSLHPGVIRTEISRHFSDNYYGATWVFDKILGIFIKSPRCGAQTTIYCAIDEGCANESGLYYSDCAVKRSSKQTESEEFAAKFWDLTMKQLKLENFNPFS